MQTADQLPAKRGRGRPSKYSPELIAKAKEYLATYEENGHKIPTQAGLCLALGITKHTSQQWEQDKNKCEYSAVCNEIKLIQEQKLIANGLDSTWNSNITKLVLSKHGYTENNANNQGNSGITVQVNRGGVVLKSGGQTLEVSTDSEPAGKVLDHE